VAFWVALICMSMIGLAGCSSDSSATANTETLTVFAASSLAEVFEDLGAAFERRHRDIDVRLLFGSSSDLATQLEQGARAGVFASADEVSMERAVDAGLLEDDPQVFARNELEIIVPPNNLGRVNDLSDLADENLVVTICNPECPAGRYAREVFGNAGITVVPDSFEAEVKGVVTRVALGEADAGIVYVTDTIAAADAVLGVPIPEGDGVTAEYPIAALADATRAADRWVEFVLSTEGQEILHEYGFLPK
jgi:molybdate transport system substrate-binding protein